MTRRQLRCLALLLLTATKAPAMAEGSMATDEARSAIAALVAAEDAGWNDGSAEAFAARALPDIVFTNIVGMFSVGRAPFVERHARIFSTIYAGSSIHQDITQITLVRPDVAIVDTLAVLTGVKQVPPGILLVDGALHTRLEQVLVRQEDGWWVASFHNVAVSPLAAGGPPKP